MNAVLDGIAVVLIGVGCGRKALRKLVDRAGIEPATS